MKKFKNKKHMALSIVALILVLLMTVGVTYSWIDDIKLVQITTSDDAENTPLKTGVDINSLLKITKDTNTINLGDVLTDGDLSYEDADGKKQTKYEGGLNAPDWEEINKKKGYFYESGNMHLSGCYSDGENFKFPVRDSKGVVQSYREGSKNDGNVSYIDFTTQVYSPDASIEFWFKSFPSIYEHGTDNEIENARFAITVDGDTNVYSSDGKAYTLDSSNNKTEVQGVRKTSVYTYNSDDNTTEENGKNSNFLFTVGKGDTVNLNIKIWLEDGFSTDITASDINLSLVSSWAYTRTLTVVDKTTSADSSSWINNSNAKLYLVLADVLADMNKELNNSTNVSNWSSLSSKSSLGDSTPFYQMTLKSGTSDTYEIKNVPLVYNNEKMMIFRCNSTGWNNTNDGTVSRGDDYKVYCWNWWSSYLPNTYRNETYTIYGCSHDNVVSEEYGDADGEFKDTNKGYGTWSEVVEIKVNPIYNGTNYASGGRFFLRDFSDYEATGETYIYTMYRDTSTGWWRAYAPKSSTLIHFYCHNGGYKNWWAYNSWDGENPQVRPEDSTTYYITGSSNSGNGYGYWDGANNVYLIASGTMKGQATKRCNMYTSSTGSIKAMSKTGETYGANSYNVYVSDSSQKAGDYTNLKFDNGSYGYGNESEELRMYPGCYYDWGEAKWRGSLSGTQRTTSDSSGGDSGSSSGGDSGGSSGSGDGSTITTTMDGAGIYLYGSLDGKGTHNQLCKMTEVSSGTYQAKLYLTATSDNYRDYLGVREASSSNSYSYYAAGSDAYKVLSENTSSEEYHLSTGNTQPLYLRVRYTTTYTFTYTTNDHKIVITT